MKLQHIAAAVALVAAGAANAAVSNFSTGDSSLFLIAFDNAAGSYTTTSMFLDLGFNLSDFKGSTANTVDGVKIVWDFGTNTVNRTYAPLGAASTTTTTLADATQNSWTAAFDKLVANADAGQIKWTIGAGDTTGNGANVNYLVTASANSASQTSSNTGSMGLVNGMFTGLSNKGTVDSFANGAYTFAAADGLAATSANGYVVATSAFGTNWQGKDVMTNSITTAAKNNLWLLNGLGQNVRVATFGGAAGTAENNAALLNGAGTFTFDVAAKTLTWETAAVPEPETYALAIAGLIVAGAVARRRRAA